MSIVVFSGAAQLGSLAILTAGGSIGAAIAAGVLLNARYLAMGLALAPSLARPAPLACGLRDGHRSTHCGRRPVPATADSTRGTWSASRCRSTSDGWAGPWWEYWLGSSLGDPRALGLDALFPAFFVSLLYEEARGRRKLAAVVAGQASPLS